MDLFGSVRALGQISHHYNLKYSLKESLMVHASLIFDVFAWPLIIFVCVTLSLFLIVNRNGIIELKMLIILCFNYN